MPWSESLKNAALDHVGALVTHLSLHTADPGLTGGSEVAGGPYARRPISWSAAVAANLDSASQPVFDVPASTTITHLGLWSAASGGTFYGAAMLSAPESFGAAGQFTLTDLDLPLSD